MHQIRIGVIGLGNAFWDTHVSEIMNHCSFELKAICDIDENRVQQVAKQYDIEDRYCFTNFHDLINCPDIDAVDIATPNDCHFVMACAVAQAGKPFLLEAPVTLTGEEADILTDVIQQNNVKNMAWFPYRSRKGIRFIHHLIQNGALGKIYHMNVQFHDFQGISKKDSPVDWKFMKAKSGYGVLSELGSCAVDLVQFISGKNYIRVMSGIQTFIDSRKMPDGEEIKRIDVEDYCSCIAELEDKIWVNFELSRLAFGQRSFQKIQIFAEKGNIIYTFDKQSNQESLKICYGEIGMETQTFSVIEVPDIYEKTLMQSFADLLSENSNVPIAKSLDGQATQNVLDRIFESAEREKWMYF